jgi:hypothetical protein
MGYDEGRNLVVDMHIELLTEIVPKMKRVALFNYATLANDPAARAVALYQQVAKETTDAKGLTLVVASARDKEGVGQSVRNARTRASWRDRCRGDGAVVSVGERNRRSRSAIAPARDLRAARLGWSVVHCRARGSATPEVSYGVSRTRFAEGNVERLPPLEEKLVAPKPEVFFTANGYCLSNVLCEAQKKGGVSDEGSQ